MTARRRPWLLYLGAAAAVLPVDIALHHVPGPVWAAAAALIVNLFRVYLYASGHAWNVLGAAALALAVRVTWAAVRFARLPRAAKRHYPAACWHRFRWRWLVKNLDLSYADKHRRAIRPVLLGTAAPQPSVLPSRPRLRFPRARFRATPYGVDATVRTIPKVGRLELEKAAQSLADQWRCVRVSVSSPVPGTVRLRGLRTDPLCEPVSAGILPPWDGRHLMLGRDELGDLRSVDLANLSGSVISGNPGRGKTESAASLAVQLVPSPAVELWVLDGGACDWAPFAPAAAAYADDNLADAEELLLELHSQMMTRRRNLEADLGTRNGWKRGPTEGYPLRWLLIEEASWYFDVEAARGDRDRERRVRACRGLAGQLLRRGRAALTHTTLVIQKPVGAGGLPPELRDLCGARWCFGVSTLDTAIAALGDDIRTFPSMSPALLQGAEHVGTAVALLKTGTSPFTFVKFPEVGGLADQVAAQAARRRMAPDDARELVTP